MKETISQVFMLLALSSLFWFANFKSSQNNTLFVGANLLKQLPKPTVEVMVNNNRFVSEFSGYTLSHPNDSASIAAAYQQFAKDLDTKLAHFCYFLNDFSKSRKWDSVRVLFPTPAINPYVCAYMQRFMIRSQVHVLCGAYDHERSLHGNETRGQESQPHMPTLLTLGPNNSKLTQYKSFRKLPVITLNFLHPGAGHEISQALARNFSQLAFVLMLGHNFSLPKLRPKLDFNYKLTLASYTDERGNGNGNNAEVKIYVEDIYGFATSSDSVRNPLGFWSSTDGLHLANQERLENFHGQVLRVTSVEGNPVVYLDRDSSGQVAQARGYLPDILETLSITLNFTYVLIEPEDRGFGLVDASGNWTGMVGQIKRQEVDIAMMSFSFTSSRKEVMDFSPPIEYSATRLLIRRDVQNTELKWNVFLEPFHWEVWLAIPCTVAVGVLLVHLFTLYNVMDLTPLASTCYFFVCFLQKSLEGHYKFERLPSRIVLGSMWVLAVVIYASYTAVLTSFLASTTEKLPISSLAEAVYNPHWKIGLVKGSSSQERVQDSPQPEFQQFSKRIERDQSGLVSGFRDGLEKVYHDKYAFFTSDLVPTFMIKDNCSFTWVPGSYFAGFGYMGYQKNLPYAASISHKVAKIRETGQMRRLFKKWWGENSGCSGIGSEFKGMSLYETGTAFLLLILGASIAFSLLVFEFVLYPRLNNSVSKVTRIEGPPSRRFSIYSGQEFDDKNNSRTTPLFTYNSDFGTMFATNKSKLPPLENGLW